MLSFEKVTPKHPKWGLFLDMVIDYIVESWPEVLSHKTMDEFKNEYQKELVLKQQEGGRAFFLVSLNNKDIGIINVFFTKEGDKTAISVAEFGVKPEERKKGYGRSMKELLETWGKSHKVTKISIEVDKDKLFANKFWSSFEDLSLDGSCERNLYSKEF